VGKRTVAHERPALAAALAGVVVVVLALAVRTAVVVVAGGPMEGGVVVDTGLSYSGHRWGRCGGGNTPIVVRLSCGREFGCRVVIVGEGAAFVGVDRGGSGHVTKFRGRVSPDIPRVTVG